MPRFVIVSDVHCAEVQTPSGDVLIAAGDMTLRGSVTEFEWLEEWFQKQPQARKFYVPGNHDWLAFTDTNAIKLVLKTPKWLLDEEVHTLGNVRIYGSPWVQTIGGAKHWAYPLYGGSHSREKWDEIPGGLDILVTHGPPYGIADLHWCTYAHLGDNYLRWKLQDMKEAPKVHIFGHIHSGDKVTREDGILYLNAAVCDEDYKPTNGILVLDYEVGGQCEVQIVGGQGGEGA